MSFRWRSLGLLPRKKSYWIMNGKSKSKGNLPPRLRCPTGCWRRLRVASSWKPLKAIVIVSLEWVRFSSTSSSYPQSKGSLGSRGHGVKFDGAAVADENPIAQGVPVRELRVLPALKRVVSRRERLAEFAELTAVREGAEETITIYHKNYWKF